MPLSRIASLPCSTTRLPRPPRPLPPALLLLAATLLATATSAQQPIPAQPSPSDVVILTLSNATGKDPLLPTARARHFAAARTVAPTSRLSPAQALAQAQRQTLALAAARNARPDAANLTSAWQPLGPSSLVSASYANVTGRVTALALDPNDPTGNTLFLGATGSGVWKSTNAAGPLASVTFAPLTDTLPVFNAGSGSSAIASLSIGAVAVQPLANPVLLAGTGDPNSATDSLYGEGILRSTDGGLTWTLLQYSHDGVNGLHSFTGLATAGLAFSTVTPTLAVAALSTSADAQLTNALSSVSVPGLYYSTDAGQTWQMATLYDGAQIIQSPRSVGLPQIGHPATAVVWDPQRRLFVAAIRAHGYYSSPDGATWTRLASQPGGGLSPTNCPANPGALGASTCPIFRGALAVQPSTGDLYALTVDANSLDQGLWQDQCQLTGGICATPAPTFSARIDNAALEAGAGAGAGTAPTAIPQGTYNLTLAAVPSTSGGTLLFAGTLDLYRCTLAPGSSTCTLRNTTNALNGCAAPAKVAPAQHALAFLSPSSGNPLLFLGNDSGLWRSLDGVAETGPACSASDASHFDNLNAALGVGGSLAEIVGFAQHPSDANTLLAGLGANGSGSTTTASALAPWPQLSAGEGSFPLLDPSTPTNWLLAIGAGVNLALCPHGSSCAASDFLPPATIGEAQVAYDAALLDAPTLLDPALPSSLLTATCRVWRGPLAPTWTSANALSLAFDGGPTPCTSTSALVRSLAARGPSASTPSLQDSGSQVLYAGMAGLLDGGGTTLAGHVFMTKSASTASSATRWTDIALSPVTNDTNGFNPAAFDVSSLAVDAHDASGATVYATIQGFGQPHLYRSTDFGAHWTNVSANLPDAPANAVLVDPSDANTVYVALDTGVFVTSAIATCPSTACWNLLGTGLPNAPVTSLHASAALPTADGRVGLLRAGTYGRGIWSTPLLSAVAPLIPSLTLSATSLAFPSTPLGGSSPPQSLTVTSTGNTPLVIGQVAFLGPFAAASDTCSQQSLAPGATCTVSIVFVPTATGPSTGQLSVPSNITGSPSLVGLSGTGTSPAAVLLTPTGLTFPATTVNQTSAPQVITVSNTGGVSATLQTPQLTGDFAFANNTCSASLAPNTGCSLSIAFTPTASGQRSGSLTVVSSTGTQVAALIGTGNAPATDTLAPAALTFATQQVGSSSPAQQVTLTNAGDVALTGITASSSFADFLVANHCGPSLAGRSTCAFSVTFQPTAAGQRTATLTVTDQFRTQTVALTGTGAAPPGVSLTPASLTFAPTGVGLATSAQTLTLTNNGDLPLTFTAPQLSAGFALASSTCASPLAAGAACTLQVLFSPGAPGPIAGTLTLTTNATPAMQSVALNGTGVDFTLTPTGITTQTVASGATATYTLALSSLPTLTGAVALTCSGAPTNTHCLINPTTGALGGTQTITITVTTGTAALAPGLRLPWLERAPISFALTLPLGLLRRRRPLRARIAPLALALAIAATLSGCGAGRTIPPGAVPVTSTPTPAGTYNLTIAASAAGLTHTTGLTLIVQ